MGKKAPEAPDYTPLADASEKAAQYAADAAWRQQNLAWKQWQFLQPIMEQVSGRQLEMMDEQLSQGRESWARNKQFWGLEDRLIADTQRYNTEAHREMLARQAAADAGRAFSTTREANERNMASMGANPNSGRFAGLNRATELGLGAQRANAMNQSRTQSEALGRARQLEMAGLGRGLPNVAAGAYAGALGAGTSAVGNASAGFNTVLPAMNQAYGLGLQGQQLQMQGLSNIMSTQASIYNNYSDPWMALLGMGAQGLATYAGLATSDRRLKERIERVGTYPNGLPMYEFSYIGDASQTRYRGVMADDVEVVVPEAVVVDDEGYKRVDYTLLGLQMEVVQ